MLFLGLKRVLGILLLIIGITALVTPLTPGAWLIFVGIELLGLGFLIPKRLRKYWGRVRAWIKPPAPPSPSPDAAPCHERDTHLR